MSTCTDKNTEQYVKDLLQAYKTTTPEGSVLIKDWLINGRSTPLYVGLLTTERQEAGYSGYSRQVFEAGQVTSDPTWNENVISWPRPQENDGIIEVPYFGLFTTEVGGQLIKAIKVRQNGTPVSLTFSYHTGPKAAARIVSLDI